MTSPDEACEQTDREEFLLQARSVLAMAIQIAADGPIPGQAAQVVAHARMVLGSYVD